MGLLPFTPILWRLWGSPWGLSTKSQFRETPNISQLPQSSLRPS